MSFDEIDAHPLFVGLTRPPMYLGVTLTFLGINGGLNLMLFVMTSSFVIPVICGLFMHCAGYVCCLYDPRIFDLLAGQLQSRGAARNIHYWGCNSYEPF